IEDSSPPAPPSQTGPNTTRAISRPNSPHGEDEIGAEVGSTESVDNVNEDLGKDEQTRATGFMGKSSDTRWLRRMREEIRTAPQDDARAGRPYGPSGNSIEAATERLKTSRQRRKSRGANGGDHLHESNYHLDDEDVPVTQNVDISILPDHAEGVRLYEMFLESCHDHFPITGRKYFGDQLSKCLAANSNDGYLQSLPPMWRAIINIVFAIGARYASLTGQTHNHDEHVMYYTRARWVGIKGDFFIEHPDYQKIQVAVLLGFYFLTLGHINR
ncbi:hypothetical protein LTS18_001840, partial [Coniosporium uncinatum]